MTFIWCPIQLDSCSKAFYSIIIPRSVPIQHTRQLVREHTTHGAIIGAKHYSNTYPLRPVRFSFLWMSEPRDSIAALEPRSSDPSATSPMS